MKKLLISLLISLSIFGVAYSGVREKPDSSVVVYPRDVETGANANFDSVTGDIVVISQEHHEMHECDHFFSKTFVDLTGGADSLYYFMFKTADSLKYVHAKASFSADVEVELQIYEGATVTDNGTEVDVFNNNRNCTNEPLIKAFVSPTFSDGGDVIWRGKTGTGKDHTGVSPGFSYEIIVKPDTYYLWEIKKVAVTAGYIDADFWGYEHQDKN